MGRAAVQGSTGGHPILRQLGDGDSTAWTLGVYLIRTKGLRPVTNYSCWVGWSKFISTGFSENRRCDDAHRIIGGSNQICETSGGPERRVTNAT